MAKERAKLTEKQERILVQCQLMGLSPRDMTQISNRLVLLEKENEYKREISEVIQGMTWTITEAKGWQIVDSHGRIFICKKSKVGRRHQSWYDRCVHTWDIEINGPDKRYKNKSLKEVSISINPYIPAKLCPEKSKGLYSILIGIHSGRIA